MRLLETGKSRERMGTTFFIGGLLFSTDEKRCTGCMILYWSELATDHEFFFNLYSHELLSIV